MTSKTKWIGIGGILGLVLISAYSLTTHRSTGSSLGQSVNAAIDNLLMTGTRLLELPLFILLIAAGILSTGLAILVSRFAESRGRVTWGRAASFALAGTLAIGLALLVDRKINGLQGEVTDLRIKLSQQRMAMLEALNEKSNQSPIAAAPAPITPSAPAPVSSVPAAKPAPVTPITNPPRASTPVRATPTVARVAKRDKFMFDIDAVPRTVSAIFGQTDVHPVLLDEATDVVRIQIANVQGTGYPVVAYLGIVNLKTPGLEVKVGGSLTVKTYTSDFGRQNDCAIAINGEAGASPQNNSGLGIWTGNFMTAGKLLQKETPDNLHPFLSFDQTNNVSFTAMASKGRTIAPDIYNVIWGRLDAVVNDKVQTENERDRQPRTAMGIDKDGSHLYLLVIDGRQQRYSVGFTRAEVGVLLQAFGAANGMLCDEGGSSCMWIPKLGGIINSPSDGEERPTYTHFGISLKNN